MTKEKIYLEDLKTGDLEDLLKRNSVWFKETSDDYLEQKVQFFEDDFQPISSIFSHFLYSVGGSGPDSTEATVELYKTREALKKLRTFIQDMPELQEADMVETIERLLFRMNAKPTCVAEFKMFRIIEDILADRMEQELRAILRRSEDVRELGDFLSEDVKNYEQERFYVVFDGYNSDYLVHDETDL